MDRHIPAGFIGECESCGAIDGHSCEGKHVSPLSGKEYETYYCVVKEFSDACDMYWWNGVLFQGKVEVSRCSLSDALSKHQSLWEYDGKKIRQWWRGRFMDYPNPEGLSWWSLGGNCPFPMQKTVFYSDLETKGVFISNAKEAQLDLRF